MMDSPYRLDGYVAIVTGGGAGIGRAVATEFAAAGARVVVADLDADAAAQTCAGISEGADASAHEVDVSDAASCTGLVQSVLKRYKRCDVLVNNAGIGHVGNALEVALDDFRKVMAVNVEGMYLMSQAVLAGMVSQRAGAIVNLASALGLTAMQRRFAYTVSKHAVVGLTRSMAFDFATEGVRVNCVCPGRVETPFVQERIAEYADPQAYVRHTAETHPIGRMAQPEEIARAVLYLASPASSYMTGSAMVVDGGYLAGK